MGSTRPVAEMIPYSLVCLLVVTTFGWYNTSVVCQTYNETDQLMTYLLNGYNKKIRPPADHSQPVKVNVSMDLVSIQEFNEVAEKFSVVAAIYLVWTDDRMQWNPADYGNIDSVIFPVKDVWHPFILLGNAYEDIESIQTDWLEVRYYANGRAESSPGGIWKVSCSVDVTYYPFDEQECYVQLLPWGYSNSEIQLFSSRSDIMETFYEGNGEWNLYETTAVQEDLSVYSTMKFFFKIRRKPKFSLINMILPIVFMGVLNILVFALPVESGERVSYAITVMLAIAVFLTLVSDSLPQISEPMSILSYYLMTTLILSALICVVTIFNLRLYFKDSSSKVPKWLAACIRRLKCDKIQRQESPVKVYPFEGESGLEKRGKQSVDDSNVCHEQIVTWKDVSSMVDILGFLVSLLYVVITTWVFLTIMSTNN